MAFINFINISGGDPEAEAKLSAMTENFTETIERTVSSITLPSGTTTIGENAFASCSALTEVTIPASVQTIEANAFGENRSLETINFEGTTPPSVAEGAFSQLPENVTVNVPEGSEDAYSAITEDIEDSTAFIVEYTDLSGNTTVWYSKYSSITYSDATNAQPTVPEAGWAKIETKGVKTIDDNAMLFEPATEYVFDEALKNWYCTPLRGNTYQGAAQPTKVTFKSTSYDYFDGRIAEACTGLSSITFYCTEAPLMNTEYISSANTAEVGELLVPNAAHNYGIYKERICGDGWTIKDLSGRTMGTVTITTGDGTETYNYYNAPYNAAFVFRTDIINGKIEGFSDSGGQLFQGCTNLSSVTIDGHIRLEGNIFYGCSNLTEITWLNETSPSVDGSGQFDGVASAGTLYVNSGSTSTWENFRDTYLSGWTVNEIGDETTPYCEIDSTDWIRDYGVNIKVGTSPAPIRIMYNDEQTVTIVDGRILYMQPIGEFSVNYDAENDDLVIIENSSQEPITHQQKEAMFEYVGVNYDSDYGFIKYDFGEIDTVTVDNDDYTGLYTYCEYIEDMA